MDVQLKVLQGRPAGHLLRFPQGEFMIGRGPECHIRPNSEWISRQHCMLRVRNDGVSIRDLGSTNGTLVNGCPVVGERPMRSGDTLQLGALVLQLLLGDDAVRPEPGEHSDTQVLDHAKTSIEFPSVRQPDPS